jgi:hypothetical protein
VYDARDAYERVKNAADDLAQSLMDLHAVQNEYEDWKDNLPENLQSSALGERLEAVCDLEIEEAANDPLDNWGDVESLLDEVEGIELPQGFGRD